MNTRKLVSLFTALAGLAVSAFAQTQTTEASVAKLIGSATVTLADGSTSALVAGSKVPQGATITTAAASEVYLQSHSGTVTTIKGDSTVAVDELSVTTEGGKVTDEKTTLSLKSGNLVAALDPTKRSVNNYKVRTPKGVAAARGTTFTVSYNGVNYSIVTTSGSVVITASNGTVVTIAGGQASVSNVNDGASTAVADLPATEKADAIQAMAVAVATIAVAVENNMIGASGAAELRSASNTVIAAAPEAAATIAALVAVSAPTQSQVIVDSTREVAPQQSAAVEQAMRDTTPSTPNTPSTPGTPTETPVETPVTTPQPIDPSTVSRSGE